MKDRIVQFINEDIINGDADEKIEVTDDLLGSGLIDSMGLMKLVGFLETEFGVKIPATEIVIENFENIDSIANYLQSVKA